MRLARTIQAIILLFGAIMYGFAFYDWVNSEDYQEFIRKQ